MTATIASPHRASIRPTAVRDTSRLGPELYVYREPARKGRAVNVAAGTKINNKARVPAAGTAMVVPPRTRSRRYLRQGCGGKCDRELLAADPQGAYEVRRHDIVADPPPGTFNLVHARL